MAPVERHPDPLDGDHHAKQHNGIQKLPEDQTERLVSTRNRHLGKRLGGTPGTAEEKQSAKGQNRMEPFHFA